MTSDTKRGTVLLANVGVRDVLRDEEKIASPRGEGKAILDDLAGQRERLSFPLLAPTLDFVLRARGRIERCVLFATDNPSTASPSHRENDTLNFAEIIKRALGEETAYRGIFSIHHLKDLNPSHYDQCYAYYQSALRKPSAGGDYERVYVLASGGTPAMNLGLLVAAIEQFGDRCIPLYLQQGESHPIRLNLGQQLRQATLKRVAASHVRRYQFAAAADVLRDMDAAGLGALAEYAAARLNFDWDTAWSIAGREFAQASPHEQRLWERLHREVGALADRSAPDLFLGERYHRARVAYGTGAYSEFLALLVALEEASLREIIAAELGIDFSEDNPRAQERRKRQVAERPDLAAFLATKTIDGKPLNYVTSNRFSMEAVLDYLIQIARPETGDGGLDDTRRAELIAVREILKRVDEGPAAGRNRSVHGDGGASLQLIDTAYNPSSKARRDLIVDLRQITTAAGGRVDDWAVDLAREMLLRELGAGN